jgi:hypothetical protein
MYKAMTLGATAFVLALSYSSAFAAKPYQRDGDTLIWNGNNFPSGTHYNLNIHGKKDDYTCPPAEYDDQGNQVFGNVVNVSRNVDDYNGILMESGGKGPKSSPDVETLEVADWCTQPFDGDDAIVRIPKDSEGYMVLARITGKPGNGDTQVAFSGCLQSVFDESGNDMITLGLVLTDGSSYVPKCTTGTSEPITLVRYEGSKGKGAQKATDITRLFEWSGTTYRFLDTEECSADAEGCVNYCCPDSDGDGVFDVGGQCEARAMDETTDELLACADGYTPVAAQSTEYVDEWVFNIGDFVDYLWTLDNDGAYNIKVRFYPLSQQQWWPLQETN